jgi:hypothetical protein
LLSLNKNLTIDIINKVSFALFNNKLLISNNSIPLDFLVMKYNMFNISINIEILLRYRLDIDLEFICNYPKYLKVASTNPIISFDIILNNLDIKWPVECLLNPSLRYSHIISPEFYKLYTTFDKSDRCMELLLNNFEFDDRMKLIAKINDDNNHKKDKLLELFVQFPLVLSNIIISYIF